MTTSNLRDVSLRGVENFPKLGIQWRVELGELLCRLVAEGRTLVIATHDEEFARTWATRVLRVREGVVTERDNPGNNLGNKM